MKGLFVDEKKMYNDTFNIFKDLDIKVDPRKKVADLPIAERQMIEIAKATSPRSPHHPIHVQMMVTQHNPG